MTTVGEISARFVEEYAALDPVRGIRLMGVGANGTTLTDYSPDGTAAVGDLLTRTRAALETATEDGEAERLGRLFLTEQVAGELGVLDAGERERTMSILGGPPAGVRMVFDLVSRASDDDWEAVGERLGRVAPAMEGYRASLERGIAAGRTASKRCSRAVADQLETWAGGSSPGWFSTFVMSYGGDGALAGRLRERAAGADAAYGALAAWIRDEYVAHATETEGVGDERYRVWGRSMLGTDLDLDEAYAWGWAELERLEREKAVESDRVKKGASFEEVRELLMSDPSRAVEGVDAWRAWLQQLTDRTIDELNGTQFEIAEPLLRCEVSSPPEGSAAAPYYTPPSDDLVRPGRIWFPPVGRTRFPTWDAVTTVFHEAVPGHHLQLGATRLIDLTRAQQFGFNSAHGEGWALYAERLMDELGRFEKPEYRLGFLSMQAFRAARVVVDIGLHTGRPIADGWPDAGQPWTYDRAVAF